MNDGDLFEPPKEVEQLILRDYQEESFDKLRAGLRAGHIRQVLCSPTGSGKSVCAVALLQSAVRRGSQTAFLVDRIDLVDQMARELARFGVPHGIRQGGTRYGYDAPVHVWSSQTMEAAIRKHGDDEEAISAMLRRYDLVIYDECHAVRRLLMEKLIKANVPIIGLSATPFTKGLGKLYSHLVNARTTDQLTKEGWLVPFKIYVGTPINMQGAATQAGEWTDAVASERALPIIGDVVAEWRKYTREVFGNRHVKTIAFVPTVADGADLCRQFGNNGVKADQVSYHDKGRGQPGEKDERRTKIRGFRDHDTEVLVSVDALGRGFDVPHVECIIMLRPFRRSVSQVIQQLGRGARIAPNKSLCIEASQRVLTDRGLVPISLVRNDDLLWDGIEWVSHSGAVCIGRREVIEYAGLVGTPDHKVWTRRGWRTLRQASQALDGIAETGAGRTPIRLSADRFRSGRLPWAARRAQTARSVRVRRLRKAIYHRTARLTDWTHFRLQIMQQTASKISVMALGALQCSKAALYEPARRAVLRLRRSGDLLQVQELQGDGALDYRQLRIAGPPPIRPRPHRQRRSLRAGQSALGSPSSQYEPHKALSVLSAVSPVPPEVPGDSIRRRDSQAADVCRSDRYRDHRTVRPTVEQAEGEVWDILNAGPRHRFTCEGLTVSNCLLIDAARNYTRFAFQIETFWASGLTSLDDSNLEQLNKPAVKDDPGERECRECSFVIPPGAKECPMCGWKPVRKSKMVVEPGTMTEYQRITDEIGDVWPHVCAYAQERHPEDVARANKYARVQYKELTGQWPRWGSPFTPGPECDERIAAAIRRNISDWIRRNAWKKRARPA